MYRFRGCWVVVGLAVLICTVGVRAQTSAAPRPPEGLTLADALQLAADHYPAVRAALEQIDVSRANVDVTRSAYLPHLDALWQFNRATANNIFGQVLPQSVLPSISGPVLPAASGQSVWGSAAGALVSWEPFDLGLRQASVREAEASLVRASADETLTRLDVESAVATAFLAVVSAQQTVVAADADVQRRGVLARTAHTLADNQLRPGAEASRADAERAAAQTRAIQARQTLIVAQSTLSRTLGVTSIVSVDATRVLDTAPPTASPSVAPAHPLAQSRQAAVDQSHAHETVLSKTDRPRLYVQSSVFARGSGANPDGTFDGGADGLGLERANWAAGLQVVFPNLFDFAGLRARRAAAAASTRTESALFDEARLIIAGQQQTADALADAARAIALNTPVQLSAAQQSEAQARARFEAGLASIVEVAETQSLLAQAEYQNNVAKVDVWRALLAQATARGDLAPFIAQLRASGAP